MKTLSMLTASAALLVIPGCAPAITVNPGDTSPPVIRVTLVSPGQLRARYMDENEPTSINDNIDPNRVFQVTPVADAVRVVLLFTAQDDQSGISSLSGSIDLTFTCIPGWPLQGSSRPGRTIFSDRWTGPAAGGTSVPPAHTIGVGFNLEEVWERQCARHWGEGPHAVEYIRSGRVVEIWAHYDVTAENNSASTSYGVRHASVGGVFKVADVAVNPL
jgi:hypothetical protein